MRFLCLFLSLFFYCIVLTLLVSRTLLQHKPTHELIQHTKPMVDLGDNHRGFDKSLTDYKPMVDLGDIDRGFGTKVNRLCWLNY